MIKTRIGVFNRRILFGTDGALGEKARAKLLADFARKQIDEIDARNAEVAGHKLSSETFVDGSRSDNLSGVKSDSEIVTKWELGYEVVKWVFDLIHESGPVLTGDYRKSATIFADDEEVDDPSQTVGAKEVVIVPLVPYARKIERGKKKYAPGAVYQGVAAMGAARFGNIAQIRFGYRSPTGTESSLEIWAQKHSASASTPRKRRSQLVRDLRQPAVIISF